MSAFMAKVKLFRARATGLRLAAKTMPDPERASDAIQIAEHWDLLADEVETQAAAANKSIGHLPSEPGTQTAGVRT